MFKISSTWVREGQDWADSVTTSASNTMDDRLSCLPYYTWQINRQNKWLTNLQTENFKNGYHIKVFRSNLPPVFSTSTLSYLNIFKYTFAVFVFVCTTMGIEHVTFYVFKSLFTNEWTGAQQALCNRTACSL